VFRRPPIKGSDRNYKKGRHFLRRAQMNQFYIFIRATQYNDETPDKTRKVSCLQAGYEKLAIKAVGGEECGGGCAHHL